MQYCEFCKKPFTPKLFHFHKQRFCSRKCQNTAYGHQHYKENKEYYRNYYLSNSSPGERRGNWGYACLQCGKEFIRKKKYCNRQCNHRATYERAKTNPIVQQHKADYMKKYKEARMQDPEYAKKTKEYMKRWRDANPERIKEYEANQYERDYRAVYPDAQLDYELGHDNPLQTTRFPKVQEAIFVPVLINKVWKNRSWRNAYTLIPETELTKYLEEHPEATVKKKLLKA